MKIYLSILINLSQNLEILPAIFVKWGFSPIHLPTKWYGNPRV